MRHRHVHVKSIFAGKHHQANENELSRWKQRRESQAVEEDNQLGKEYVESAWVVGRDQ